MGLETCEDVQKLDQSILLNIFGKMGKRIWDFSHGIDDREIQAHRERKSIGVERTLSENIRHLEQGRDKKVSGWHKTNWMQVNFHRQMPNSFNVY